MRIRSQFAISNAPLPTDKPILAIWLGHLRHYFCSADSGQLSVLYNADINVSIPDAGIGSLIVMGKVHDEQAVGDLVDEQMHVKRSRLRSAFCCVVSARFPPLGHRQSK